MHNYSSQLCVARLQLRVACFYAPRLLSNTGRFHAQSEDLGIKAHPPGHGTRAHDRLGWLSFSKLLPERSDYAISFVHFFCLNK